MSATEEQFVAEVLPRLRTDYLAFLRGDPEPRIAARTPNSPATWLGQFGSEVTGAAEIAAHFRRSVARFADGEVISLDLINAEVVGDAAFLATHERINLSVDGIPTTFAQRVSRVFRRDGGDWMLAHEHAALDPADLELPWRPTPQSD